MRSVIQDVVLSGTAERIVGANDQNVPAQFQATAGGFARSDLSLSTGTLTEVRSVTSSVPSGAWSDGDGQTHPVAGQNLLTDATWFFPALVVERLRSDPSASVTFVGLEGSVAHFQAVEFAQFTGPAGAAAQFAHWTQTDIYLDSTTLLPVRHHAPNSTIIVQGAAYSDIWDLIELPTLADSNLIYNFHYYEPHIFTHQGATWGLNYWLDIRGLPFPATDEGVSHVIEHTDSPEARWRLLQYKQDHWDADRIAGGIGFAAQWAHDRDVPLMCDEFGVYRNFADPDSRERWLTAVRTAFDKNHIGWTMRDYQGGFGVVYKENGELREDETALRALGLKK